MADRQQGLISENNTPMRGRSYPMPAWVGKPLFFFLIAAMAVLISRDGAIEDDREINVDESLFMSQAARYAQDMVPWRSVDTGTSGPLNVWPFALLKMAGVPLTYSEVHTLAALILVAVVCLTWVTLRQFASPGAASLGAGVLTVVICRARGNDFVHFSSELIPVFLISAAMAILSAGLFGKVRRAWAWPVAAFLLGAAPWAKLQAAPICLVLFLGMVFLIWFDPGTDAPALTRSRKIRLTGVAALAFVAVSMLMTTLLLCQGCFRDFWDSYVSNNVIYAGDNHAANNLLKRVTFLFTRHVPFREFNLGLIAFAVAWILCGFPGLRRASPGRLCFLGLVLLFFMTSLASALTPVFGFPHYDWFVFQPMTLVAATILAIWWDAGKENSGAASWKTRVAPALWVATAFAFQMAPWLLPNSPAVPQPFNHVVFGNEFQSRIGSLIRTMPKPKGSLAVWGWEPSWYVTTGMAPASRYADAAYLIEPYPLRDHFRECFMRDLKQSPPAVIVDAVALGCFTWRWDGKQRIDTFPALAEFVAKDYHLASDISFSDGYAPVRIYLRN